MSTKKKSVKKSGGTKSSAKLKDMKPKKDPKGGLPAIQKVRDAANRSSSSNN